MRETELMILKDQEVRSLLAGRELQITSLVQDAYEKHSRGETSLPQSAFLRLSRESADRIIALPAYLGGEHAVAGIKWVSSFPGNLGLGLERASAVVILNSTKTGRPKAILEGSVISARRTAASAALAAKCLHRQESQPEVGIIGCGVINFEVIRFLRAICGESREIAVYDLDANRAHQFREKCREAFIDVEVEVHSDIKTVLKRCSLVSFATTAVEPHVVDLTCCQPGSTILHISLRDPSAKAILSCDNVVDDVDHVCRAQTSIHLAEQCTGNRDFIRCTIGEVLTGMAPARKESSNLAVFSPFGLGVLDLAVSQLALDLALERGISMIIECFSSPQKLDLSGMKYA
jgi:ornithine cyclodeaminase